MKCEYCIGDNDGFVNPIPKEKGKGNAYIFFNSLFGAKLKVSARFIMKLRTELIIARCAGKNL